MKKILPTILSAYLIIYSIIFLLSILTPFYKYEFQSRGVYENFEKQNISKSEVDSKTFEIIKYMHGFRKNLNQTFFSTEDIIHMRDVRNLFLIFNSIYLISVIGSLFYIVKIIRKKKFKQLGRFFINSAILLLIFCGSIMIFAIADFGNSFIAFHKIFFRNNFWMLDPETSNLIKFFPSEFFQDFILMTIALTTVISLFLILFGILMKKKYLTQSNVSCVKIVK